MVERKLSHDNKVFGKHVSVFVRDGALLVFVDFKRHANSLNHGLLDVGSGQVAGRIDLEKAEKRLPNFGLFD